jgi:hypothetical protein
MSRNENPKKVLKMAFFSLFDHNGLNFILRVEKTVMLIFHCYILKNLIIKAFQNFKIVSNDEF